MNEVPLYTMLAERDVKMNRASLLSRVTSLIRSTPPPSGHHMVLEIVLLKGPRRGLLLMSEVPLSLWGRVEGTGTGMF